jgi:glycerol-3-phosphate dehydrogenase subunit B
LLALRQLLSKPLLLLPTLPPSVLGMRMHQALRRRFQQLGGVIMPGDAVRRADIENGRVKALYTRNHTDIPLRMQHLVLCSGSFFSNGLVSSFDGIREPVFGLDVQSASQRADWTAADMFAPQPYMQFGVSVDADLHPAIAGAKLENLCVAGAVLGGFDPIRQGCGAGVSMITALHAAQTILDHAEVRS